MNHTAPSFREDHVSQIPALQLLQNLGYTYLTPQEALGLRGGRLANVLLEGVLTEQLRKINRIQFKGREYPFTEGNIIAAVQALKDILYDGLIRTNEKAYDLICLGKSLQQSIDGDVKSFALRYIDWEHPENNAYHCTAEFEVERSGSHETHHTDGGQARRPDIVLFINGIPLAVIECKSPMVKDAMGQATSEMVMYQKEGEIPGLFVYSQLLLAVAQNASRYGTTGTEPKFWAVWKEKLPKAEETRLADLVNKPLSSEEKSKLFTGPFRYAREDFERMELAGVRYVTEQDRALHALCLPDRLLELTYRYILFDAGEKKVARYQQYFCVKKIMRRIAEREAGGQRKGGVVWHTQGSGKSLTMVMLAREIALEPAIANPRIVLVTDRVDLDEQIKDTFSHCGREPIRARTGRHLVELITSHRARIITTVIDKFGAAAQQAAVRDPDVFVLVDEGHRTQYGELHASMRKMLPLGCYIAFTGTPVAKKHKDTVFRFGGLIDTYTITQAVADEAVVPLLYEGRHASQTVNAESIDAWFARITEGLTPSQAADLKRKFATTDQLNKAEQKVMRIAYDIGAHFRNNWQGTPFKAQLVAQDKATAILYKKYLDEFGMVSSEVLISGPDEREGEESIYGENKLEVNRFWKAMMARFGNEKDYNKQLIDAFKHDEMPEIIIVVDKLITGFDAPRNTVLYLTRKLKDHTLLQAIARVNRLHDKKEFGYIIDYRGVIEDLDSALDMYSDLDQFDRADLEGILTDIESEIAKLSQRHAAVWDIFKEIGNKHDVEAFERLLADEAVRDKFHEKYGAFARTLAIALSSVRFIEETPQKTQEMYTKDLKFFKNLRLAIMYRYAETVKFWEYEPRIKKLIDTHVSTGEVEVITPPVNIFDQDAFAREVEKVVDPAAKADTIAYRTMSTINEKWQEDPAFYEKFSKMLQDVINAFRAQRLQANEYLNRVTAIMRSVVNRTGDEIPAALEGRDAAMAFYGSISKILDGDGANCELLAEVSLALNGILEEKRIVNWSVNTDIQNQMRNEMEDYLCGLKESRGLELDFGRIDVIMEQCLDIFKARRR